MFQLFTHNCSKQKYVQSRMKRYTAVCSCGPCSIFQNSFFTEHQRVTTSERNQYVLFYFELAFVCYNCGFCSKLTIKTEKQHYSRRSGVFSFNLEHNSHLFLVFLLLILSKQILAGMNMISLKKIETQEVIFVKKLPIFMFINRFHFIAMQ